LSVHHRHKSGIFHFTGVSETEFVADVWYRRMGHIASEGAWALPSSREM